MTGCPDDPCLIRWTAGELPPAAAADLDAHLATCGSCRDRFQQMKATWNLLGELHIEPPSQDLTEQIMSAAGRAGRFRWLVIGRAAAAIVLAAGLGVAAGWLTPISGAPQPSPVPVSSEELLVRTGLDALAGDESIIAQVLDQEAPAADSLGEEAL